jgi:hypothetical protein
MRNLHKMEKMLGSKVEIDIGPEHPNNGDCGEVIEVQEHVKDGKLMFHYLTVKFKDGTETIVRDSQVAFYQ